MSAGFVDAQEMSRLYPELFEAPTASELSTVKQNSVVKVCAGKERFWTIVKSVEGDEVTAVVNNQLANTHEHGLKLGDIVKFRLHNIYNIYHNMLH